MIKFLLLLFGLVSICNCADIENIHAEIGNSTFQNTFESFENVREKFFQQTFDPTSDDPCVTSLAQLLSDVSKSKVYAIKVLDAWGKLESGFFQLNIKWMGRYYECINIKSTDFEGKYFSVFLSSKAYPLQLQIGTCFPNTCSDQNVSNLFETALKNVTVTVTPSQQFKANSPKSILGLVILAIVFTITFSATLYDGIIRWHRKRVLTELDCLDLDYATEASKCQKIILSFSALENSKRLFNTDQRPGDINCLHGIRFISMAWVILGHTVLTADNYADNLMFMAKYLLNTWSFQAIVNGTYSVDTFFFLSGLLVAYLGMRELNRSNGKMNIAIMYCYRYIRLTPAYAFSILMLVSIWPLMGTGPMWYTYTEASVKLCDQYWWTNLLYINNLYPTDMTKECFSWGWYLANDMQFYLLSPIFLYLLYRFWKIALGLMSFITVSSMIITGAFSRHTQQQPIVLTLSSIAYGVVNAFPDSANLTTVIKPGPAIETIGDPPKYSMYMQDIYGKPYCRIGAYLIGMAFGYLLHVRNNKVKMPKAAVVCGWVAAVSVGMSIVYGLYPTIHNMEFLNLDVAAFYNAVTRPVWCCCVGWVVIACTSGYGGYVDTFLSWKAFIPLSRLTYCLYLLHLLVIGLLSTTTETLLHLSIQYIILLYCGSVCVTLVLAYLVHLMVEAPVTGIIKILTGKDQPKQPVANHVYVQDENPLLDNQSEHDA